MFNLHGGFTLPCLTSLNMSDWTEATGNIVAGINSLNMSLGAVSKYKDAKKLMQQQMDWQEEMYDRSVATNRENWQMENEYNSPANQRKLLEDAGYNPALMAGDLAGVSTGSGIASGDFTSAPAYSDVPDMFSAAAASGTNAFIALSNQQVMREQAAAQMLSAQASMQNAQTNEKNGVTNRGYTDVLASIGREDASLKKMDNKYREEYLISSIAKMNAESVASRANARVLQITGDNMPREYALKFGELISRTELQLEMKTTEKHKQSELDALAKSAYEQAYLYGQQASRIQQLTPGEVEQQGIHTANMYAGQSDDFQTHRDMAPVSENVSTSQATTVMGSGYRASGSSSFSHPSYMYGDIKKGYFPNMIDAYVHGYEGKALPDYSKVRKGK